MKGNIKNIILFVVILLVLLTVFFVLIKKPKGEEANLVSTTSAPVVAGTQTPTQTTQNAIDNSKNLEIAKDFLTLLLSVKSLTLEDSIFNDIGFTSLKDNTREIYHDNSEGRPNPFAPVGSDVFLLPTLMNEESVQNPEEPNEEMENGATFFIEELE